LPIRQKVVLQRHDHDAPMGFRNEAADG
jgi:hypothetical protein